MQFHFTFKTEIKALRTFLVGNHRGSRSSTYRTPRSGSAFGRPPGVPYPAPARQTWFPVGKKMGAQSLGTRWEGCEPGADPRYSCGWHYRKNKFNKERRQFERMSSFETQAAGLARSRFSRPPLLHSANRGPEVSSAIPSLPSPSGGPPDDAQKPSGVRCCESPVPAGFWVSPWPRRRPAPTPRASGEGAPSRPGFGGRRLRIWGPAQLWAVRVREGELVSARARASVCVALGLPSGLQRARGPPGLLFPGSQPRPPPS